MAKEFTLGLMAGNMKDNGFITKCMEKERLIGQMEEGMLARTIMIESQATVSLNGQIVAAIEVSGTTANNMAKVPMSPARAKKSTVNGKMVNESDG